MYDVKFLRGLKSAYDGLASKDNKTFYFLTDTNELYLGAHNLTNEALDVADIALAAENEGVITIKGLKEVDGKIQVSADSTLDVTFAKVASTGKAEDVAIDDTAGKITATNVEGALAELATALENEGVASKVTVEESSESGNILKSYVFYQGVTAGDDAAAKEAKKITTINIPKDFVVKSATVRTVETADVPYPGAEVGDKYIDFVVNTKEGTGITDTHLYIAINDLIHPLSGSTGTEVTVTVSAENQISATINKIAASKIAYSNTTSGSAVEETVQNALARIDGADNVAGSIKKAVKDAVEALDADVDATTDATITDTEKVAVVTGVTEVDGVITAVDSIDVDKAGAATRAKNAVIGQASDAKTADTIKGVKNYIGTIPAGTTADTIVGYIDEKTGSGISSLDSTATIATKTGNVVTIKGGLVETDGIVTNDSSADIALEEVAVTGAAADVSVVTNKVTATTVEAAIAELADALTWGNIQ